MSQIWSRDTHTTPSPSGSAPEQVDCVAEIRALRSELDHIAGANAATQAMLRAALGELNSSLGGHICDVNKMIRLVSDRLAQLERSKRLR